MKYPILSIFLVQSLLSMEPEGTLTIHEWKLPVSQLEQSTVLGDLIRSCGYQDALPLPDAIRSKDFKKYLILWSFLTHLEKSEVDTCSKNTCAAALIEALCENRIDTTTELLKISECLNCELVRKPLIKIVAEKLCAPQAIEQCMKSGTYNLGCSPELANSIAQRMLRKSLPVRWWLFHLDQAQTRTFDSSHGQVLKYALSPDSKLLAMLADGTLSIIDTENNSLKCSCLLVVQDVKLIKFSEQARYVMCERSNPDYPYHAISVYDCNSTTLNSLAHFNKAMHGTFCPDDSLMAYVESCGDVIHVRDIAKNESVQIMHAEGLEGQRYTALALNASRRLFAGTDSGLLHIYDIGQKEHAEIRAWSSYPTDQALIKRIIINKKGNCLSLLIKDEILLMKLHSKYRFMSNHFMPGIQTFHFSPDSALVSICDNNYLYIPKKDGYWEFDKPDKKSLDCEGKAKVSPDGNYISYIKSGPLSDQVALITLFNDQDEKALLRFVLPEHAALINCIFKQKEQKNDPLELEITPVMKGLLSGMPNQIKPTFLREK